MAIIGNIRKHSGLIIVAVGIALAAFVLGDFVRQNPNQANVVGEVNGEEITYREFSVKVDENLDMEKQNRQQESLTPAEAYRVRNRTWDQMVYRIIMDEEFDRLGLTVTSDELFELVQGRNPHQFILQYFTDPQTGQYNPQLVLNYLQNLDQMDPEARQQWVNFEQAIKRDQLQKKYNTLVANGYYIPDQIAQMLYEQQQNNAQIRFVAQKYTDIPDSLVTFDEQDLVDYYEENKFRYKQEPSVNLDYVVFEVQASEEDHKEIREEVYEIFEDFKTTGPENIPMFVNSTSDNRYDSSWYMQGELPVRMDSIMFNSEVGQMVEPYMEDQAYHMARLMDIAYRPDSLKASHILVNYRGAMNAREATRTAAEAEEIADSLYNVVSGNPSVLEEISAEISDDPSARQNQGDLGWFADQTMVYPFNEAVVNAQVGDIELVQSPFGFHIIKVTGKKEPVKKVQVAIIDRAIEPSNETVQDIYTEASVFAGENPTQEQFENAVTEMGLSKRSAPNVSAMSNMIPGLDNPRPMVRWAFDEEVKEGNVSPVFDLGDMYVVAVLKERRTGKYRDLEEVRGNIEGFVVRNKKAEYIKEKMNQVSGNIYQIAGALNTQVDTAQVNFEAGSINRYGREPQVIGRVFAMEPGVVSEPIQGNSAVYKVIVDEFQDLQEIDNYQPYTRPLITSFERRVQNNGVYEALEAEAEIEDNRVSYY